MSKGPLRALYLVLPALFACHPPTGIFTVDTLPGGIVRAQSSGPTEWADTAGWRLVRELVIRPPEGSDSAFGREGMLVADEGTGEIYVLDRGPAVIKRFDRSGRVLGFIGRQGAGPGEFRDMGNLYLADSFLVHHDFLLGRFSVFTRDGRFVRTFGSTSLVGMELRADDRGRMPVVISEPRADGTPREGLARYRVDGSIADTLWYPELPEGRWWNVERGRVSAAHAIPFTTSSVSILDHDGAWVIGVGGAGRFIRARTATDTLRIIEVEFPTSAIPEAARRSVVDSLTTKFQWLVGTAKVEDVPTELPPWDLLEVDRAGDLWVRRQTGLGTWRWSVLAPDGRWLGDVPAPFGDVTSSFWGKDRVYLLTENADGFPQVEVWRIDRTLR